MCCAEASVQTQVIHKTLAYGGNVGIRNDKRNPSITCGGAKTTTQEHRKNRNRGIRNDERLSRKSWWSRNHKKKKNKKKEKKKKKMEEEEGRELLGRAVTKGTIATYAK